MAGPYSWSNAAPAGSTPAASSPAPAPSGQFSWNAPAPAAPAPAAGGAGSIDPVTGLPIEGYTAPKKHRSVLGGIAHTVSHDIGLAAHDVSSAPGGFLKVLTDVVKGPSWHEVGKEWQDLILHGKLHSYKGDPLTTQDVPGIIQGTKNAIIHPLRDPFATLLTVLPGVNGLGKVALAGREGALGLKAGETFGARTLTKTNPETNKVETANLHGSTQPLTRAAQALHDRVVQKAVDTNPTSKVAAYGNKRIGFAISETHRYLAKLRGVVADKLEAGIGQIKKEAKANSVDPLVLHDAIRMTSENHLPQHAIDFHLAQARQGIAPEDNALSAARARAVHDAGVVKLDSGGHVVINAEKFPHLAHIDAQIADAQRMVDHVAKKHLGISAKALKARIDAPNKIQAGGHFVTKGEAQAEAGWAIQRGEKTAQAIEKQARREAKQAGKEAVQHASAAGEAERMAFKLRTKLTAGEKEAHAAAKVIDRHAEKASAARGRTAEAAAQAAVLAPKLERQQKVVADLLRTKASPSKVAHEQSRLADLLAQHEKVAGLAKAHGQAFEAGQRLAAVQRGVDAPALAKVTGAAEAQAKAADGEVFRRIGMKEDALARAKSALAHGHEQAGLAREHAAAEAQAHLAGAEKIVGPEARPGRNFVSHGSSTKASGGWHPFKPMVGPVVGDLSQTLLGPKSHRYTGLTDQQGKIPTNTLHGIVDHVKDAIKYVNSHEFRKDVIRFGTHTRQTERDILMRKPGETAGKITEANRVELGQKVSTMNHAEALGVAAGYDAWLRDMIPSIADKGADMRLSPDGKTAPDGYVWIDKNIVGDLARPITASNALVTKIDDINATVTAMTVYFKLGHLPTRLLTNASTNIIQGILHPTAMLHAIKMWKAMEEDPTLKRQLLALTGQGSYESLPAEGMSRMALASRWGAKNWAHFADARFRFNSIIHEAKQAGYDTPEKLRTMVDKLEHPHNYPGMDAADHAKLDWVVKRADRAAIAYDRLTVTEKRFLARGIWFYPWVKGSSAFFYHFLTEHPAQALAGAQAGQLGRKHQYDLLGDLPSYESGLIPIGGGKPGHAKVTDFSTFSPFATAADVARAMSNPSQGELAGMANPVLGALDSLLHGTNQYGQKSKAPVTDALSQLFAPTPEAQIAFPGKNSPKRMFQHTRSGAAWRAVFGPATPRDINLTAAHQSAARDRAGR